MGSWAVKTKITKAFTKTSKTNFQRRASSSLYQICLSIVSQNVQPFQIPLCNAHHHKHVHASLPIISFPCIQRFCPMLFQISAPFTTVCQSFDEMPKREQRFDDTHFHNVLDLIRFSTVKTDIVTAVIVHCFALKVGALAHLPTSTSLLIMYSRAGYFGSSVALFGEILYRDVIIWNAMMTASIENRCFGAAVNFLVEMMKWGSGFDSTTLVIVLSAVSDMNELKQGRAVHCLSMKAGMLSDSFLCNALTDMYAKCGDLSSSECVFAGMQYRDLISWNSVINGCLYHNNPEKSLWYFREMASCGLQADAVTHSCAIAASTCLGELGIGQVIHGWGIKLGYHKSSHISFANSLISLYSQCGNVDAANNVFEEMAFKDVISWNSMIHGFASNGDILEAFSLLHEMLLAESVQPDTVTVLIIIPLCAELMLLREGRTIHGFTIRRDMAMNMSVTNSLMDMYLKCSCVKAAEHLFNAAPERDLISWNTMISGYSQNGNSREAQTLFKELHRMCSKCNLSTLLAVLPSCNSLASLHFGKSIHCWQLKLGFSNNILAVNSLMFMYMNCEDLIASFSLLRENSAIADTACWNTLIAGCTRSGYFWKALETFNIMKRESHVRHDSITLVNAILACGNLPLLFEGKLLHGFAAKSLVGTDIRVQNALITMYGRYGEIVSAGLVFRSICNHNLCSWNCMISAFSQNKDGKSALELFRFLDFEPNEITMASILSACTQLGVLRHGKQIHGHVFRFGFQRNSFVFAALVDMYANCGRLDIALKIFDSSPEKSVAAWNSMISAYGFHSNGRKAIELFHDMIKSGTKPTKSTFINLLSSCSHSGLVNEGVRYYERMFHEFGVEPATEHQVCMVDMLGRSGRLHEAYQFIKQMPSQPEPGVWGALLSACNLHGDLEMGREVAKILFELEPDNVGYYVSLSNMYVAAGSWSDAVELRGIIQDKQLKKPAGYSLIDVGFG
ncbi:pentatricopeptide repeat-containing protein At4g19220, mitochondrial [Cornus florida]|uniref:pentatricopeptide repeat-containing protein At4g19220, mitochondrial n=1 Tax=Cornus florida TaxID=4283 RepID=UPI002898E503|nr:pentatricopeptide repeat-containing protein At4g19220, mitochondrial [Cornus florida]